MKERSHIELLSNRLKTRIVVDAGSEAMSSIQLARSGFSGQPIGDRYSPTSRIGRGRLGEIYAANDAAGRDIGVERRVALQRIDDRIVAEQRFVDELESGYTLLRAGAHPNVVKTLDFFRDGKSYYIVMELLEGVSLRSVLDDAAPEALSLEETASIVRAIGDGLQYLHAKSLVHGDLRPANVFVTFDYGIKLLDVAPMSPLLGVPYRVEDAEQASRSSDVRDDVYDLACLTYELLAGRHPFNANSPYDAHRSGLKLAPIPELTARQWQAIARGLALQRAHRTPSVAQFLSDFGIMGSERLRASDEDDAPRTEAQVVAPHTVAPVSATVRPAAPDVDVAIRAPQPLQPIFADREPSRPRQRRKSGIGSLLLLVVLVGAGTFTFRNYDALRAGASDLIANVGAATAPPPSEPVAQREREAGPVATGLPLEQADAPAAAPATEPGLDAVAAPPPSPVVAPQPLPPAETQLPVETVERNEVAGVPERPVPVAAPAERAERANGSSSGPAFRFTQPVITIGEGQTAAAVVIERSTANAPATIVWWTSGNTALADEDYADLGQRTERFATGERSRTIYVPLVADGLPERTETFYIYLGQHDARRGHLRQLSNVRVNIRDND